MRNGIPAAPDYAEVRYLLRVALASLLRDRERWKIIQDYGLITTRGAPDDNIHPNHPSDNKRLRKIMVPAKSRIKPHR